MALETLYKRYSYPVRTQNTQGVERKGFDIIANDVPHDILS